MDDKSYVRAIQKSKKDIGSRRRTANNDLQGEVAALGLKINSVVSLSSCPAEHETSKKFVDEGACFGDALNVHECSVVAAAASKKSSECVVDCVLQENYINGVDARRNGGWSAWQPVVRLVDIYKTSSGLSVGQQDMVGKGRRGFSKEEDDCIVVDKDCKMPDIIVVDDPQEDHSDCVAVQDCDSSSPVLPRNITSCHGDKNGQKRTLSPCSTDCRPSKIQKVDGEDGVLILDPIENLCESENVTTHESVHSSVDHARTGGEDSDVTANTSMTLVRPPLSALKNVSKPPTGDQCVILPDPESESSMEGKTIVLKYSKGLTVEGEWDGHNFNVFKSSVRTTEESGTRSDVSSRSLDDLAVGDAWVGNNASVPSLSQERIPDVAEAGDNSSANHDKENPTKSAISASTDYRSLVSYDLSDSNDTADSPSTVASVNCSDDVIVSRKRPASRPALSTFVDSPTANTECVSQKPYDVVTKKSFYGSRTNFDEIFPKQYSTHRIQKTHKRAESSCAKLSYDRSQVDDVVHISSDEDDISAVDETSQPVYSGCLTPHCIQSQEKPYGSAKLKRDSAWYGSPSSTKAKKSRDLTEKPLIEVTKIVYQTKTYVPISCHLTPVELKIILARGSFSFELQEFRVKEVRDGRIIFRIPHESAKDFDKMLNLPDSGHGNRLLTVCVHESTPTKTLMACIEQISMETHQRDVLGLNMGLNLDEEEEEEDEEEVGRRHWRRLFAKMLRKRIPKKLPSWSRPRHWNRPFFCRYVPQRPRVDFDSRAFVSHYDTLADDAFLEVPNAYVMDSTEGLYHSYYDEPPPIQVSGFSGTVMKLFTYPPPPTARGITVTNEDLFCLNAGEYVNDVIIDFYLKYLFNEVMTDEDRNRTHIFSSFFYGHLVSVSRNSVDASSDLSVPERRHQKVRTWTRHVDLFSKDFIIVPINENYHWFLAIICFPGISKADSEPEKPVEPDTATQATGSCGSSETGEKSEEQADSTVSPMTSSTSDATDTVAKPETDSTTDATTTTTASTDVIRNPCILIFDSLQGDIQWDVACTLREYLQIEWAKKRAATDGPRTFQKDLMKGCRPQCPQQPNYSDCGLYLLQYVEAFFKKPLKDFRLPIRYLKNWFEGSEALAKRSQLRSLILRLKDELNPDFEYDPLSDGCCNDVAADNLNATL